MSRCRVEGLCRPGPRSPVYFSPDDRRFRSSFLCVFHREHMWGSLFHKHSRAVRQIHNSRADSRHSTGSLKSRYVRIYPCARFHLAGHKPRRSYSRDAHAATNFQFAKRCGTRYRFRAKLLIRIARIPVSARDTQQSSSRITSGIATTIRFFSSVNYSNTRNIYKHTKWIILNIYKCICARGRYSGNYYYVCQYT